jgi:hypothetical protein
MLILLRVEDAALAFALVAYRFRHVLEDDDAF